MSAIQITAFLLFMLDPIVEPPQPERLVTRVSYSESVLVISNGKEVCVVCFEKPIFEKTRDSKETKEGSTYKYRHYDRATKKEKKGSGAVFEYTRVLDKITTLNLGSVDYLIAQKIGVTWSNHTDKSGWVYYNPETTSVQVVEIEYYEKLTLFKIR
jgi:hypothetical protein